MEHEIRKLKCWKHNFSKNLTILASWHLNRREIRMRQAANLTFDFSDHVYWQHLQLWQLSCISIIPTDIWTKKIWLRKTVTKHKMFDFSGEVYWRHLQLWRLPRSWSQNPWASHYHCHHHPRHLGHLNNPSLSSNQPQLCKWPPKRYFSELSFSFLSPNRDTGHPCKDSTQL